MARLSRPGLKYFNMSVDFFDDPAILHVAMRFELKGEMIAFKLLCKIFKYDGYFIKWDDGMATLLAKGVGKNISSSLANDVVSELLKRGFFNKAMYKRFGILTSTGIQKTYVKTCRDGGRKCMMKDIYLVNH